MKKSIIVALAEKGAIGRGNELLVHLRSDLKRFKEVTMGHPMIMGRNTFLSIGKPLPGRTTIVVTSNPGAFKEAYSNLLAVSSLQEAFDAAAKAVGGDHCFIVGGASIYSQCIALADDLDITRVEASFPDADAFFPPVDEQIWEMSCKSESLEEIPHGLSSPVKFHFEKWSRKL